MRHTSTRYTSKSSIFLLVLALVFAQALGALHRTAHGHGHGHQSESPLTAHAHTDRCAGDHDHDHDHHAEVGGHWLDAVLGHAANAEDCAGFDGLQPDLALASTANAAVFAAPEHPAQHGVWLVSPSHRHFAPPARGPPLTN